MKLFHFNSKDGFSLIEVVVALAVMSIAGLALTRLHVTSMKANKSTMIRTDLEDVKRTIANTISCDNTVGAVKPSACSGTVGLRNRVGRDMAPGGKIGEWNIEATCEVLGGQNGLSIYATKRYPTGDFMIDPLRNIPLNKSHPISMIFKAGSRICSGNFVNPALLDCPEGARTINFDDRTYTCADATWEPRVSSLEARVRNLETKTNWMAAPYCIVQKEGTGCPAGYGAVDPGTSVSGAEGALEGRFLMGAGNSGWHSVRFRGPKPGSGRDNNFNVRGWAFCCIN